MTALWLSEAAARFWEMAGGQEPYPRTLERSVALALPLATVKLPQLRLKGVEEWLTRRGICCGIAVGDRSLRGCLAAYRGNGLVFIDGADPADEMRFTLAHEVAHFLLNYHLLRERAVRSLGPAVLDVLDGIRPPTSEERVHAVLGGAPLGLHLHLLGRSAYGHAEGHIDEAERKADLLALELLAPVEEVRRRLTERHISASVAAVTRILTSDMGLPLPVARWYATVIAPESRPSPSLVRQLGLRQ